MFIVKAIQPRCGPPAVPGSHQSRAHSDSKVLFKYVLPALIVSFASLNVCGAEIRLSAAASLSDALKQIAADYQRLTGDRVALNFGASSTLARQLQEGAPADIFFSADDAQMDSLQKSGLLLNKTRIQRLSNTLVIIVAAENGAPVSSPQDLADPRIKRIALGNPRSVPIGLYAKRYLDSLNLWQIVSPKVIPIDNVRAALAAVEEGNADASIVYKTDAAISRKVKVVFEVRASEGPKINYPLAILKNARQPEAARALLNYLNSEAAAKVFQKFGFIIIDPSKRP